MRDSCWRIKFARLSTGDSLLSFIELNWFLIPKFLTIGCKVDLFPNMLPLNGGFRFGEAGAEALFSTDALQATRKTNITVSNPRGSLDRNKAILITSIVISKSFNLNSVSL